jgi:CelD/BcsL family acetyltransferase involved in cellulose biosynthesis
MSPPELFEPIAQRGGMLLSIARVAERFGRSGALLLDLPRQDAASQTLAAMLAARGYKTLSLPGEACPRADLAGGMAAVEGRLPSWLRKRCGYEERRLAREGPLAVDLVPSVEVPAAMGQLMEWHTARFRSRGTPGSFFGRRSAFHQRVAARYAAAGLLRLSRLRLGPRTVALLYALRAGKRYFYYAAGFDPAMGRFSPGLLLLRATIRLAAEEGMQAFDFLRGDEGYKMPWATARPRLQRIVAAMPGRHGYLALAALSNRTEMVLRSRLAR